ncbi:MAG: sugar transferase [Thermoproteota archaeon]
MTIRIFCQCYKKVGKRAFDLIVASIAMIILLPISLLIALAIRFSMGPPVIFRQVRPGLRGKPFVMYKFRTMLDLRDEQGNLLPDEKRLTLLGRFLRRFSLDEIPELWNVIKGDMSIVGPRPLLMEYLPLYTPEQARRHEVKPGMAGPVIMSGRNLLSWEEKFKLDVWYVDNLSFKIDIQIFLRTLWKVLKGEGVSAPNHVTMPKFKGNQTRHNEDGSKGAFYV